MHNVGLAPHLCECDHIHHSRCDQYWEGSVFKTFLGGVFLITSNLLLEARSFTNGNNQLKKLISPLAFSSFKCGD